MQAATRQQQQQRVGAKIDERATSSRPGGETKQGGDSLKHSFSFHAPIGRASVSQNAHRTARSKADRGNPIRVQRPVNRTECRAKNAPRGLSHVWRAQNTDQPPPLWFLSFLGEDCRRQTSWREKCGADARDDCVRRSREKGRFCTDFHCFTVHLPFFSSSGTSSFFTADGKQILATIAEFGLHRPFGNH